MMARRWVVTAFVILSAAACGQASKSASDYTGPRFNAPEEHCSIRPLEGWSPRRERGSLVFQATAAGLERNTIAIRAVPLAAGGGDRRAPEAVLAATAKTLQSLPAAQVGPGVPLERTDFRGLAFGLTFAPVGGAPGARYERQHIVLIGEHYVFHILLTAPAGALLGSVPEFQAVVDSFREEV